MNTSPFEIDHLFRVESGKMVAVLAKILGFDRLEAAEDIVQDTFIKAVENWKIHGYPDNPQGWLYTVAKNKATDYLRRGQVRQRIEGELYNAVPVEYTITAHLEKAFYEIKDNQLGMLFAVCHPVIPEESQVSLALKTLGGFSTAEIAKAFLTNEETINKRLYRAKDKLRKQNIQLEIPQGSALSERTSSVLKTIYLLYNEGYHSTSQETVIRKDLCLEAIRLALLIYDSDLPKDKDNIAILAMMCFHTSRFESRINEIGELVPFAKQNKEKWNKELIQRGIQYLRELDINNLQSAYQVEAGIAYLHTIPDSEDKWSGMLALYNQLRSFKNNPVIILNIAFVISKARNNQEALDFLNNEHSLVKGYLYHALSGELLKSIDPQKAKEAFETAIKLATLTAEKKILEEKLAAL